MMEELFFPEKGIYYRTNEFRPGRLALVFIHGLSGSSSAWKEYEKFFGKEYNIISLDLRGHGKSRKPKNYADYEIKNFTEDIHELIKHLGIKNYVLISHSFATLIALDFLSKYQSEVAAVVFLSPSFNINSRKFSRAVRLLFKLASLLDILPFPKKRSGHIDYSKYPNTGDWNLRRMLADAGNTGFRIFSYCTSQSYEVDYENFLGQITIPVLIVHGKKDSIFPVESSLIMAKKIKNSSLVLLDNADHIIVLNNFNQVSEAIDNFVKNHEKNSKKI